MIVVSDIVQFRILLSGVSVMSLQYVSGAESLLEVIFLPFTAVPFVEEDIVTDSVYALPGSAFLSINK